MKLIIGTRGSALALAQSEHIRDRLLALPGGAVEAVELKVIHTRGDRVLDVALSKVGGKGLFTKELEEALLSREVDLAVHSLKDMPSELPPGLVLAATTAREDPRDAWVRPEGAAPLELDALARGAVVGTSSLRRQAQLLARRPDLRVVPLRGNVGTRLRKLDEGQDGMEAIVLAAAGLRRLGLAGRISRPLDPTRDMLPAVGQGALTIEVREDDAAVRELVGRLTDRDALDATTAERAFLRAVEGGCQVPACAHATLDGERLQLAGFIGAPSGDPFVRDALSGARAQAAELGRALATRLLDAGGREIMAALRAAERGDG
ncbi:MAG: hydroxymethylbilane synthase [Deltaproteobacteria bacterium]|nr:hydroxymethylbilane synthase [Deltaproteobacteria bacterium]MCB9788190.1 hydroxymethylbilane synthase [Deltaproteobacteria bacterium]